MRLQYTRPMQSRILCFLVVILVIVGVACSSKDRDQRGASAKLAPHARPTVALSPEQRAEAEAFEQRFGGSGNDHIPHRDRPQDPRVAVYLAARSDDPGVVNAALDAMVFGPGEVDASYMETVSSLIALDDPRILDGALEAAQRVADTQEAPLRAELAAQLRAIARSHPHPTVRALAFATAADMTSSEELRPEMAALENSLLELSAPEVLFWVLGRPAYERNPDQLARQIARVEELTRHDHPVIRGAALERIVSLLDAQLDVAADAPDRRAATEALVMQVNATARLLAGFFDDPSPHVRAHAALAIGSVFETRLPREQWEALSLAPAQGLGKLLDDTESSLERLTYEQIGVGTTTRFFGATTTSDPPVQRRAASALESISRFLAERDGNDDLELHLQSPLGPDEARQQAKVWYARHAGKLAPPGSALPSTGTVSGHSALDAGTRVPASAGIGKIGAP